MMDIIIDTDPAMGTLGGDPEDGFAIMLALQSPELNVRAITVVHGNTPLHNGYSNAVHLLELMGQTDIPVAPGLSRPIMPYRGYGTLRKQEQFGPWKDPLKAERQAVDLLVDTVLNNGAEPVTIVTIGPLSNVAAAILCEPRFAPSVHELVMMGGAATVPGNSTPAAEFNFFADPEAASIVFNAGIPLVMVGLDVCHQTEMTPASVASIGDAAPLARFVSESCADWLDIRRTIVGAPFHLYDSLSIAVAFQRDLVETESCWVDIETTGRLTSGQSVAYLSPYTRRAVDGKENCRVCLKVDAARFARLFEERVLGPLRDGTLSRLT